MLHVAAHCISRLDAQFYDNRALNTTHGDTKYGATELPTYTLPNHRSAM
jgi:hypothetical protein